MKALIKNSQLEMSAIEAALRTAEAAATAERLDRVKALRTAITVLTPDQCEAWTARMRDRHHDRHQWPINGNGTRRHEGVFNQDPAVGTSGAQQAARFSDNEPMGTTGREMEATSTALHRRPCAERRASRFGPSAGWRSPSCVSPPQTPIEEPSSTP